VTASSAWSIASISTPYLRERAALAGAELRDGLFERISRDAPGLATVHYRSDKGVADHRARARLVIGADGATSAVGRAEIPGHARMRQVFAYHEIIRRPADAAHDGARCDVYYQGRLSPDFYAWIFPHGETVSVGTGSAPQRLLLTRRDPRSACGHRPRRLRDDPP
jgi:geranylgeranyl reductase